MFISTTQVTIKKKNNQQDDHKVNPRKERKHDEFENGTTSRSHCNLLKGYTSNNGIGVKD